MGTIRAICISTEKGTVKKPVEQARFIENYGIEGDAHAGGWHRQVSLLSYGSVKEFEERLRQAALCCPNEPENLDRDQNPESGYLKDIFENKEILENKEIPVIAAGSFGENLLVEGLDLKDIACGTILQAGDVVLRITQRGKECHSGCRIRELTGDCIMPREGVFAEVIKGGILRPGEEIFMENPEKTGCYRAAVVTLSDKASRGEREDKSGPLLAKLLKDQGFEVIEELILSDEAGELKKNLIRLADRRDADLIVTTGGTGFAPRDITPEATMAVATKNVPGIAEAIRAGSMKYTPKAMLSRAVSVIRNRTLIINFPGSPKAVEESFELIKEVLPHGLGILTGREGECARNGEKS